MASKLRSDTHPAHLDAPLQPSPAQIAEPQAVQDEGARRAQPPPAWVARNLAHAAGATRELLYVASSDRRADEIGRALRHMAPDAEVLVLPAWDCLPYDRASPSREVMGRRMAVLSRLCGPADRPRLLLASAEALLQRIPPARTFKEAFLRIAVGDRIPRDALQAFAARAGYVVDDRIDEPGEIAFLGEIVDIFPAAAERPYRLTLGEGDEVQEIKSYDPLTQRTDEPIPEILVGPASEVFLQEGQKGADGEALAHEAGLEHRAPAIYGKMDMVFARLPKAARSEDAKAEARARDWLDQVAEAYEAHRSLAAPNQTPLPAPDGLYLTFAAYRRALRQGPELDLPTPATEPIPRFALERNPGRAFSTYVQAELDAGHRVVLCGLRHELRSLARALQRGLNRSPDAARDWLAVEASTAGVLLSLEIDVETGFRDADAALVVIAASDVLGGRLATKTGRDTATLLQDPDLRVGDVVLHEDHGLGVLTGLEQVEVAGEPRDAVRLEYHGGAGLLAPVEEFGKLWRYGAEAAAVTLDRLHTGAWTARKAELSQEIERTAEHLVAVAKARAEIPGRVLQPPRTAYARFAARFPYPETPDQAAAIEAVLADLGSGRVMNRLVCGDVGFGKTEVALRAAAAAALAGAQVAVVAPTTVLARQHYESFRRRFAGAGIEVGRLSRLVSSAEAKALKAGVADGSIRIVVGTHALAAEDVAFADLGLLIIDEEQRFGAKLKQRLRELGEDVHLLTMTATPIPRTLQLAMVGVEDVSVIATPPARRRPIRTFLAPFDGATVRTALLREKRRGGQSFVVVPRIEDIPTMTEELSRLAPELVTRVAHGGLPAEEVDEAMVGFANGDGDVLLATNIIESGLDVPRANTMLVWRADCFGLAQLHQLRGRVGRGRAQGVAYLLVEPDRELPEATRARLSTLEAFDRLGSGLAISARDLELRGAGDLIGEEQAGHVKLIGTALYQRLLTRAVRVAKGEITGPDWTPELNIGLSGALPESYVPDATLRINLYARLARLETAEEVEEFAEELEDRFGHPPAEVLDLMERARLSMLAKSAGVVRIDAGPKAVALTLADEPPSVDLDPPPQLKDGRLIWAKPAREDGARTADVRVLLQALEAAVG